MNCPALYSFAFSAVRHFCHATRRRVATGVVPFALLGIMFAASPPGVAQIPQPSGAAPSDNRASAMGSQPDPAASVVHESHKPQAKGNGQGNSRGKTAGQEQKTQGAGGFDNGLYGTGAGSNK
jgi:hypothetical protein